MNSTFLLDLNIKKFFVIFSTSFKSFGYIFILYLREDIKKLNVFHFFFFITFLIGIHYTLDFPQNSIFNTMINCCF